MIKIVEFDTAIGTSNLGDDIILESLRHEMAPIFLQGHTMRLATHTANFTLFYMLCRKTKMQYVNNADYKFVMGTNLLTHNARRSWVQWPVCGTKSWVYENAIMAGVGATTGEGRLSGYTKRMYRRMLNKKYYHSVRDENTKKILEDVGVKVINTGCPTLWSLTPEHCAKIPRKKADRVVFTVSGFRSQINREQDALMLQILKECYSELYFWCQTTEDEKYLDSFDGVKEIRRIYNLNDYAALLDSGNIDYVGTRLHGGVYAMQHYVRSITIAIDHRARGFHESNNLPICERDDIAHSLKNMITNDLVTDIRLDTEAINQWKNQFATLTPQHNRARNDRSLFILWFAAVMELMNKIMNKGRQMAGWLKK